MISTRLKQFLDRVGVGYDVVQHDPAFTAQQVAARMHVPGREFVKVVVVRLDGNYALAVLPAPLRIDFKALAKETGTKRCQLASEAEFQRLFPDCELGAMPPFGALYDLPTYADESLAADENLVFNAGTHAEAIRLRYSDFVRLAQPKIVHFGEPPPVEIHAKKKAAAARARRQKQKRARPKKKAKARARAAKRPKKKQRARRKPARQKARAKSKKKKRR